MEVEVKTEGQEQTTPPVEAGTQATTEAAVEAKEGAKEEKQEAQAASSTAEAAAEVSMGAAQAAEATKEEMQRETSSLKSVVDGLTKLVEIQNRRVENLEALLTKSLQETETMRQTMQTTLELHQDQVAEVADAAEKVQEATAALVKMHLAAVEAKA